MGGVGVEGIFHLPGGLQHLGFPGPAGSTVAGLIVGDPAFVGDGEARRLQAIKDRDVGAVIDIARADAALDGPAGACAEQRHRDSRFKGQDAGVFQQDDARCSGPAGQGGMRTLTGRGQRLKGAAVVG